jgi:hypothetical protein
VVELSYIVVEGEATWSAGDAHEKLLWGLLFGLMGCNVESWGEERSDLRGLNVREDLRRDIDVRVY